MKKISLLLMVIFICISCKKEVNLSFKEQNISITKNAVIDINYPKAEGTKNVADLINKTVENYIANQTNITEDTLVGVSINDAIKMFDNEYTSFKKEFTGSGQKWEILIDAEVTYKSPQVICIAVNSYLDTGGAHGNGYIKFLNFNPQNGTLLTNKEIIKNMDSLSKVIEYHFIKETNSNESTMEDYFFGRDFELPASIGFNDEGIIILYNTYEIASYAQGITDFTIPYNEVTDFLNIN